MARRLGFVAAFAICAVSALCISACDMVIAWGDLRGTTWEYHAGDGTGNYEILRFTDATKARIDAYVGTDPNPTNSTDYTYAFNKEAMTGALITGGVASAFEIAPDYGPLRMAGKQYDRQH
jgi:hypothetical protein